MINSERFEQRSNAELFETVSFEMGDSEAPFWLFVLLRAGEGTERCLVLFGSGPLLSVAHGDKCH